MISNDIGQLACLYARLHNLTRVYFGGFFIRGHPVTMHTITYSINFFSKVRLGPSLLTSTDAQYIQYIHTRAYFILTVECKSLKMESFDAVTTNENMGNKRNINHKALILHSGRDRVMFPPRTFYQQHVQTAPTFLSRLSVAYYVGTSSLAWLAVIVLARYIWTDLDLWLRSSFTALLPRDRNYFQGYKDGGMKSLDRRRLQGNGSLCLRKIKNNNN